MRQRGVVSQWGFLVFLALVVHAAGCAPQQQQQKFSDPLKAIGKSAKTSKLSTLKLGILLSDNTRQSMKHVGDVRSVVQSMGIFTNVAALEDGDPRYLTVGINRVLEERFKEVLVVDAAEDAPQAGADLAMMLDVQIQMGSNSGTDTTVKVTGIFLNSAQEVIETITGQGSATIPFPAWSYQFKPAADEALSSFAGALDGSPKLAAAAETLVAARSRAPAPVAETPTPMQAAAEKRYPVEPVQVAFKRSTPRPDDIAVIIGNADYGKLAKDIPDVMPAYADAEGIKRYITQALGVSEDNIIFLKDAKQADLVVTFGSETNYKGQLHDWIVPGQSRVFVYYSGHGAPGEGGTSYLVPADAQAARIELNGYPLKTLYGNLGKLPAKSVTVVLEACFSGTSDAGSVISSASPVYLKAKKTDIPPNITVVAAGAANQIASWEEDKSHGLFTKHFLLGMSGKADAKPYGNGDSKVGWNELGRYLDATVTRLARRYYGRDQTPQIVIGRGE